MPANEKPTVNDGGGLLDSFGLIDSLIVDCNEIPKALNNGEYVRFCNIIVQMVHKLALLRNGIKQDSDSMKKQIDELTEILQKQGGDNNV